MGAGAVGDRRWQTRPYGWSAGYARGHRFGAQFTVVGLVGDSAGVRVLQP
jgi:hypothetical protein